MSIATAAQTDQIRIVDAVASARPELGPALRITGPLNDRFDEILTPDALAFLTELHHRFAGRRLDRLADRMRRRFEIGNGHDPRFREDTAHIREDADWRVAGAGPGLEDRRVEITGPTDPKMTINALNSGARVWLADQEDATSPTWGNVIGGQLSLRDAIRGELTHTSADGREYRVTAERTPTIVMRPRGWHLAEKHIDFIDRTGRTLSASGSLVDFGLYFFHNAQALIDAGRGPYFYIAKLESSEEARLWNDVFSFSEEYIGIPHGTIRATVLIETLPAAFEMDEILFELKEHSAGLNCGRWDYIFSFIKKQPDVLLPDRAQLTMDKGFLRAYTQKLIQTCHRRGAFAMGGMAAQIPIKDDPAANEAAMARVRADKEREARDGHDGTWVAHPALVAVAKAIFDEFVKTPNQLQVLREDVHVTREDLLRVPEGTRTDEGLRHNVRVGVRYLEAWLRGQGCVPLFNLMEDAATAEISRAQVWQLFRHGLLTVEKLDQVMREELGDATGGAFSEAKTLFRALSTAEQFEEFLTLPAYQRLLSTEVHT